MPPPFDTDTLPSRMSLKTALELIAEVDRQDRRGRLVGAEAMIVSGSRDDGAQERPVEMDASDDRAAEEQEVEVVVRGVSWVEEVPLGRVADRPVHVLARAIDAGEGLFVEQADEAMLERRALHDRHHELLVIGGHVGGFEVGRDLELPRRDLVVVGLGGDAELEQLVFEGLHEDLDAPGDGPEVVIVELLALGRRRAEERASGEEQVGAAVGEVRVDQEVLLLGATARVQWRNLGLAHQFQDFLSRFVHRGIGAQKRDLLVERLARPGHEDAWDHEGRAVLRVHDVDRARRVPGRVTPRGGGHAKAAVWKRGAVRLAFDEKAAGELGDGVAVGVGHDEAIVLFRGDVRHRVEDVGEEFNPLRECPIFHGRGDDIGRRRVEGRPRLHRLLHRFEGVLRKSFLHGREIEDIAGPDFTQGPRCRPGRDFASVGDLINRL